MLPAHSLRSAANRLNTRFLRIFLLLAFAIIVALPACVKDRFNDVELTYNGTVAFPVATVGFTLAEVLEGDTLLTVGDDNAISLIYRKDNFFTLTAADLLAELTGSIQENFSKNTKLGAVAVADINGQFGTPFSNLVDDFQNQAVRQLLQQNQGNTVAVPAFQEYSFGAESVPVFNDFNWLKIESGKLVLTVANELFVDLQNFKATIFDNTYTQAVGSFDFAYLPTGGTQSQELDLQGKTIGNDFNIVITSLHSPGSGGNPVLIDLNKKLQFTLGIKDVAITAGEVALQPGLLTQDELQFQFNLDNGERIYQIALNDVKMAYNITSEIKTAVQLRLTFPHILKNNSPVVHELTVPPTLPGSPLSGVLDFSGTLWHLDYDADQPFNQMDVQYEVIMQNPTGSPVAFSSEDKVGIHFTLSDLDVEEVRGYFGSREEVLDDGELDLGFDFSLFAPGSSPLFFEDPKMRIQTANSFGIPLRVDFNATARGGFDASADLNPPKLTINYPALSEMGQTKTSDFLIFKNNSNLVEMLSVYPAAIKYGGLAAINPANDPQAVNFIRSTSQLTASVELNLPFRFRVQDLVYRDTGAALVLGTGDGLTVDDIQSAELKILYTNGMPLKTTIRIIALGANGSENTVAEGITIEPAAVNQNGQVTPNGKAKGELFVVLSGDQIRQMDGAANNIYEIRFQTGDNGQAPAAMYTDYDVELKIGMTVTFDK